MPAVRRQHPVEADGLPDQSSCGGISTISPAASPEFAQPANAPLAKADAEPDRPR